MNFIVALKDILRYAGYRIKDEDSMKNFPSSDQEKDMEEALRLLIASHASLCGKVESPEILASASLTFGISRFAEIMGDAYAAHILEQTAIMLRRKTSTTH